MDVNLSFKQVPTQVEGMRDDISQLLEKMRSVSQEHQTKVAKNQAATSSFDQLMQQANSVVNYVNQVETESKATKDAYLTGVPSVSLTDVVVSAEKSSVAFQALLSIRNKLLEAYQQIMQMPV